MKKTNNYPLMENNIERDDINKIIKFLKKKSKINCW